MHNRTGSCRIISIPDHPVFIRRKKFSIPATYIHFRYQYLVRHPAEKVTAGVPGTINHENAKYSPDISDERAVPPELRNHPLSGWED
jgi:hypothetical protein